MWHNMINKDKVMHRDEFYRLNYDDRRELLQHWRTLYPTSEIKRQMGISNTAFYSLLKRLDLPSNLGAYRDSMPSQLETIKDDVVLIEVPENIFGIEVKGTIKQSDVHKLLEIARNNDLEVKMK